MDEDSTGVLQCDVVEDMARGFLRGNQREGFPNTDFESQNDHILAILSDNESGEITQDEMSKFMQELIKNQI